MTLLALIVSGYAGWTGWSWWVAVFAGAIAGIWRFGVRLSAAPHLTQPTPGTGRLLLQGTAISAALSIALALGAFALARWMVG